MTTARRRGTTPSADAESSSGALTGYEAELWRMADALRGSMDAAEYKHVVLGLIFLKYISDAFLEMHAWLESKTGEGYDPEDMDEYRGENIFWVPPEARWPHLKAQARQSTIGQLVDDAMAAIERDNPALKDVLPKDYARPALDKTRLGQIIDLITNIRVGDAEARSKDVLGRVYEYFLSQFASAEGKKGGEFYTPRCVVKLLVEMLEPYQGRVYDPCCGSSGMFVQSMEFIHAHATGNGNGGKARGDISIWGQESNHTTWKLAKMNLAIRGIDHDKIAHGDSFHNDRHPDLRADYILANPPFNVSGLGRRAASGRQAMGVRRPSHGQRQLRLGAAHGPPPVAARHGRLRPCQRLHVVEPVGRGRDSEEPHRGGPGGLHGGLARSAFLLHADTRLPLVPRQEPQRRQTPRPSGRGAFHRRPQAWPHGGPHPPGADRRRHRPHRRDLPRLARRGRLRRVPRRSRLLQERDAGGGPQARPRPHARPLRRRGATGGRRGTFRGQDGPALH